MSIYVGLKSSEVLKIEMSVAFVKYVSVSRMFLKGQMILNSRVDKLQNVSPIPILSSDDLKTVPEVECEEDKQCSDVSELRCLESETPDSPWSFA